MSPIPTPTLPRTLLQACAIAVLALPGRAAVAASPVVRIASDDWCPFVCASGGALTGGFLVDATQRAMALHGHHVEATLMPLNRAMLDATQGKLEGIYAPPLDGRLLLSSAVYQSRACFYTRAGDPWHYSGPSSLRGKVVGIVDDYGYDYGPMDEDIAHRRHDRSAYAVAYGTEAGTVNVTKLLAGRFGVLLEHEAVLPRLLARQGAAASVQKAGCLEQALPLVVGFGAGKQRAQYRQALEDGWKQMEANGEMTALKVRYGLK